MQTQKHAELRLASIGRGSVMDASETLGGSNFASGPDIRAFVQKSGIYVFLISFTCVYYLSNAPLLLGHYDLGWHLAAGDLIRDRGSIPFQDPWSFTLADKQWYNLSWLWDVIASVLFQHAGFGGLTFLTVACGAVIVGYLTSLCLSSGASAIAVCISVFAACLLYPTFVTPPNIYLAASPNTATMMFCVIFYAECLKRTRRYLLPVMMVLWTNLHGGFLLGFPIVGAFCGTALLRRDWANLKIYGLAGIGCFAAIFVNPLGWHIYHGVAATLGDFAQTHITEWMSYFQNMSMPGSIPGVLYMLIFVALELRYRKGSCPLEARLLSWLFLLLGLCQFRYMSFFFIFSSVPLALHLDRLLPKQLNDFEVQKGLLAAGIMGACALPLTYVRVKPDLGLAQMISEQDARHLQTHFPHARLLNHWNVGGLLIFYTRGAVPVFVDGRAATAYPDALLRDYFKLSETMRIDETAWDTALEKYHIDAVLWVKAHQELRRFLVDKRGWKEEYAGLYESLYVKP
jgi:hypothetical protein